MELRAILSPFRGNSLVKVAPILAVVAMGLPLGVWAQEACESLISLPSPNAIKIQNTVIPPKPMQNPWGLSQAPTLANICCESVVLAQKNSSLNPSDLHNPYIVGKKDTFRFIKNRSPLEYSYLAPEVLHGASVTNLRYLNNPTPLQVRINGFLRGLNSTRVLEEIGQGLVSKVFLFDPEAPTIESSQWLKSSARYVVKFRHYFAGKDLHYLNYFKRDLAMRGLAEELSTRVTFKRKSFIRVAKDYSTPADLIAGRMVQEAVHGPSAYALAEALYDIEVHNSEKAHEIVRQAGIDPFDAEALNDLNDRLAALEKFYIDTHDDVLFFNMKNKIPNLGNKDLTDNWATVGLDLGHGLNVHMDPKTGQWVMIDW